MEQAKQNMMRSAPKIVMGLGVLVILLWLATGFYVVGPGEQGVIRHFGKEVGATEPGLHYHLPWPIQQVNVVSLELVRRAEIGFRSFRRFDDAVTQRVPAEALMLTGDANIVEAQVIIQYKIKEPSKYLFRLRDPDENLRAATEVALRAAVGNTTIDEVLTAGRARVQDETEVLLQQLLDDYQSGLLVTEVKLQVVDPPDQVKDAFHEVVRAKEDKDRLVNQARGYKEDVLPKARGEAQKALRASEAYKAERVLRAQGDADRFLSLYGEYRKAPQVTRDRLYLEAIGRNLPKVSKMVLSPHEGMMPLLSLPGTSGVSKPLAPAAKEALRRSRLSQGGSR